MFELHNYMCTMFIQVSVMDHMTS